MSSELENAAIKLKKAFEGHFWRSSDVPAAMNVFADFLVSIESRLGKIDLPDLKGRVRVKMGRAVV